MENLPADAKALVLSVVYVGAIMGAGELLRRRLGRGDEFTRKVVHVGVGLWIIPTLFLFTRWYWAALLPAAAAVGNFLSLKFNLVKAIERGDKNDYGTVLFAVSFVICIGAFFRGPYREAAAVGITVMALGDAAAAIVGKLAGRHPYTFLGARKSIEGSAAMLVVSFAAAFGALVIFRVPPAGALGIAAVVAPMGTVLEAAGKHGSDNLTVPLVCSTISYLMLSAG